MSFLSQEFVDRFYSFYTKRIAKTKEQLQRPLTLTEKILFAHLGEGKYAIQRGICDIPLYVDRVAMQDATAQMALLQFMNAGKKKVEVPTTIHCDHLIRAQNGARDDIHQALIENNEVYSFLHSAANKYGIGFWKPGAGIIHQVLLENYAMPGTLMIGTDSHTPNAGGLSMIAIGVGGADAVDSMLGTPWYIRMPHITGIKLSGKLQKWCSAKDIILKVAQILTVKGGTGKILEYFGEGCSSLSATGKATITNMGAEVGATTSIFPYDLKSSEYLRATARGHVANACDKIVEELQADIEVSKNPLTYYDEIIEIDLSLLEPQVVGPHTPDLARSISKLASDVRKNEWPMQLSAALIGSCTNSSYEDMSRAASFAAQAAQRGIQAKIPLLITPGSEQIHKTMKRDGQLESFTKIGGTVLANACGPCIGQWRRDDSVAGSTNSIITSYNRNFKKRNDGNPTTHAFISSPEMVIALALAGRLDFNPLTDSLEDAQGNAFWLDEPTGDSLPAKGFVFDTQGYEKSTGEGEVNIDPTSKRIAKLEPFTQWNLATDFSNMRILLKTQGKCTTDHISPAGPWLKFRGHLDNISDNMYSGATSAFTQTVGKGTNMSTAKKNVEFNVIARDYKQKGIGWMVVGDNNYGEGSSREHAAMEPRHLGCRVILAKSFARIAETNLKKQGILPLTFKNPTDYAKFKEGDLITISPDQLDLTPGENITVEIRHEDGLIETIDAIHTLSTTQIEWFYAGSAINWIRLQH